MHSLKPGRRYRVNEPGHKADGRVGVLEVVKDGEAWLMVGGRLARVQVQNITDTNVVQMDLAPLRVRQDPPLLWADNEAFA